MSSVNPNNIDGTYPIAGQDNDSQGFRDNFTNIKNNFTFTATELTDLQNNAILKSALSGTTLNNNLNNAQLIGAQISKFTETRTDIGTQTGPVTINWSDAHFQTLTTSGSVTLTLTNWPTSGFWTSLKLEIDVTNVAHTLTLPAAVSVNNTNIQGISSNVITFPAIGKYLFEFSTYNGGTTILVRDLLRNYDSAIDFSQLNVTGNVLATGLSVFGNTRIGLTGTNGGQFHTVVGNITQTSSGGAGAVYFNTTGNVLAAIGQFGTVNTTGNVLAAGAVINALTVTGAKVESGYQIYNPTANVSIQANVDVSRVIVAATPSGGISDFYVAVTLPNVAIDGKLISINSNTAVASFRVLTPWVGYTVDSGANVALAAGSTVNYLFHSTDNKWFKV
jgi:hypothetical protein